MNSAVKKCLNRDVIKYIAVFAMLPNHIATAFLKPGTWLFDVCEYIGYFTAVTMCYFLVEGYAYTHSKVKYAERLFIFGVISQIPYVVALQYNQLNMMFTLLICFAVIAVMEKIKNPAGRVILVVLLIVLSAISDWGLLAPVYTLMFIKAKNSKNKMIIAYGSAYLLFVFFNLLNFTAMYTMGEAFIRALLSGVGIVFSGIVILVFYNGNKAAGGRVFSKWFFYIFYPAHLAVIMLIKLLIR